MESIGVLFDGKVLIASSRADEQQAASESDEDENEDFNLEGEFQEDDLESSMILSGSRRSLARKDEEEEGHESPDADLEFEYEPGISLSNLEFGQQSEEPCWPENCLFCGVDYETGRPKNLFNR